MKSKVNEGQKKVIFIFRNKVLLDTNFAYYLILLKLSSFDNKRSHTFVAKRSLKFKKRTHDAFFHGLRYVYIEINNSFLIF